MTLIIILIVMAFVFFDMGYVVDVYYRNNHNRDNMITVICYGICLTLICVAGSIVA